MFRILAGNYKLRELDHKQICVCSKTLEILSLLVLHVESSVCNTSAVAPEELRFLNCSGISDSNYFQAAQHKITN